MEEERDIYIYTQLHKVSAIKSETQLEEIIETLWRSRKMGLSPPQKSHLQSLLNLPTLAGLNPVLACLRSLIRKCVHENLSANDISTLFPPDLPLDLQRSLVAIFQRCQTQWKEDVSVAQPQLLRTNFYPNTNVGMSRPNTSLATTDISASTRPLKLLVLNHNCNYNGDSNAIVNVSHLASLPSERGGVSNNQETLPHLKSMTWTLDNKSKTRRNKVAVISLKLQDHNKSPMGESEVKFQVTRDTVDAILKSMTQIDEQFSTYVGTSTGTVPNK